MTAADDCDVLVRLPDEHRAAFKDPLGPITTDPARVLDRVEGPLLAVGDVVTYHFERAGRSPDVGFVDGQTKRTAVDPEIERTLADSDVPTIDASNPPGTLTASLLTAIHEAIGRDEPVRIDVDGEEDLATIPALLLAPIGASVVYGQPDRGMVHVAVTHASKRRARELLALLEGDHDRLGSLLDG